MNEPRWDINNFPDKNRRFYISYHDNSHYASVESLNQSSDMNKNIQLPTKQKNQQTKNKNNNSNYNDYNNDYNNGNDNNQNITKDEESIMLATGIEDLSLIREAVENFNDLDSVYNYLFSLSESLSASEISSTQPNLTNSETTKELEETKTVQKEPKK